MSHPAAEVSPAQIFGILGAYHSTSVLVGAIEIGLFTAIAEGAVTPEAIGARCAASPRGVRIAADALCVLGLLTKTDGTYGLTPNAALFLDKRSPAYLGGVAGFLATPELVQRFMLDPAGAIRRGGSDGAANTAPDNPIWVAFARGMAPMMAPVAEVMAQKVMADGWRPTRILDIAAGHGLYGITAARHAPEAHLVAQDWAAVLAVARENGIAQGVGARMSFLAGNAFEVDFGGGFDLVLLPNFLHHFDEPTCVGLLVRLRAAMAPGGRLAIIEFVPDEDRIAPPAAAMFALTMLVSTPAGDAYTASELTRMCLAAGFGAPRFEALAPTPQTLALASA